MLTVQPGDITELIESGQFEEGVELEAKRASGNIPANAWETISAFANTSGGVLVLGLDETDDGWVVQGVAGATQRIQDLHNLMRDTSKISRQVARSGDIWKETIDDKDIIVVRIHPVPRSTRPVFVNGKRDAAYVRNGEGDALCTHAELDRMRREASMEAADRRVIPFLTWDDFDPDSVWRYRELSRENRPDLPHHRKDFRGFLRLVEAWRNDRQTGEEGPTVAGILMFGTGDAIREIRHNHVIDYRRVPSEETPTRRWSDRVRWTGNLFDAWEEIFPRLTRGLPTPFLLVGPQRRDRPAGRDSLREAFVNLLVHTDYSEISDALILHRDDGYFFRNPGDSWVDLQDLGKQSRSERRNPVLAQLFSNAGLADQAGSGFARIYDEWHALGFQEPSVGSDPFRYEFRLELSLASMLSSDDRQWLSSIGGPWREDEELALIFARHHGTVDNQTLRGATGQHLFDTSKTLGSLRDRGYLTLHGSGRNTHYELGPVVASSPTSLSPGHLPRSSDHLPASTGHLEASRGHLETSIGHLEGQGDRTSVDIQLNEIAAPIAQSGKAAPNEVEEIIVQLCAVTPLSTEELSRILDRSRKTVRRYVGALVDSGRLEPIHEQRSHPDQRYRSIMSEDIDAIQQRMDLT